MTSLVVLLASWATLANPYEVGGEPAGPRPAFGSIGGVVVNGSQRDRAMPGAEVVVRAAQNGELTPIAATTCDEHGQFLLKDLPALPGVEYLVGANHQGVHYPGPRVAFRPDDLSPRVRLVAYDALTGPSPLLIQRHEIKIHATERVLEVTERLVVANLLRRGYIGEAEQAEQAPATLRLTPFPGFLTVTFEQEFLGRNFRLEEGQLVTSLPWPPGAREIAFSYQLPIEHATHLLRRPLDLPTEQLVVRRTGLASAQLDGHGPHGAVPLARGESTSNEPTLSVTGTETGTGSETPRDNSADETWSYQGAALPAGQIVELTMTGLPVEPLHYAKWGALGVLVCLGAGSVVLVRRSTRRAAPSEDVTQPDSAEPVASHGPRAVRRRLERAQARATRESARLPTKWGSAVRRGR